jgi:hypothetical protein
MKQTRVIVKTVSSRHKIYVEHNGERTLYAVTDKIAKAKDLVLKAKRELGIARGTRGLVSGQIPRVKSNQPRDDQQP